MADTAAAAAHEGENRDENAGTGGRPELARTPVLGVVRVGVFDGVCSGVAVGVGVGVQQGSPAADRLARTAALPRSQG